LIQSFPKKEAKIRLTNFQDAIKLRTTANVSVQEGHESVSDVTKTT